MSSLLEKLKKSGAIKAVTLSESIFFNEKEHVTTDLPILNMAFSGTPQGGIPSGITVIAGASKSFKTLLGLYCIKAYLDKYKDSVCLFYDSEFGTTPKYVDAFGIPTDRVLHIPIEHIEQLKFDLVKRLDEVKRGDKVFVFIDSVGNLASKKEVEDARKENEAADMTRAKAMKSLFRIITPHFTTKNIPGFIINHTYKTMEMYAKDVVSGGTGIMYSANQVFIITKAQEKDGDDVVGSRFTIVIEKSRTIYEKSKLPFVVLKNRGIQKYSGLLDLAIELGYITRPTKMSYAIPSLFGDKTFSRKDITYNSEIWEKVLVDKDFVVLVEDKFIMKMDDLRNVSEIEEEYDNEDEDPYKPIEEYEED